MSCDDIYARTLEYDSHPSRDRVKALHARIKADIPDGWRICGENLYAARDIHYRHLEDHFLLFSVWDDSNHCLSWEETLEWAELLGLRTVPVLWRGTYNEHHIRGLYHPEYHGDPCEGYVVRVSKSFPYRDFKLNVGKYVRASHQHIHGFKSKKMIKNQIISEKF